MLNVRYVFQVKNGLTLKEDRKGKFLVVFQGIKFHLIFDIKIDGKFTRKARFVSVRYINDPPESLTYSRGVSVYIILIAFNLAARNDLDICACDIGNAYLNARCK